MPRCLRALSWLLLFLLSSCLEFDAQEITFRYDPEHDRIDALVVYRGLYAEGGYGSDKPMEKALAQLDAARTDGVFAFWCHWPFKVDPVHDSGPGTALLPHYQVESGGLFTDEKGVLCGYQFVRIQQAKAFLQKIETMLEVAVQAGLASPANGYGGPHKFDSDTKDLLREFLRAGEKMLVVDRGRIELRFPCTRRDHRWLKSQMAEEFLDRVPDAIVQQLAIEKFRAGGGDPTNDAPSRDGIVFDGALLKERLRSTPGFRLFWDNDFAFDRREDLTTFALGERGAEELVFRKAAEGKYHDGLLTALRERGEKIEQDLPDQELQRRFVAFRGRECVLPEGYAASRKNGGKDDGKGKDDANRGGK